MTNLNRRNFLKAAGLTGAIGAAAATTAVVAPQIAKAEYSQPASWGVNMAITYLDEPSYNLYPYEGAENLERYDYQLSSFESQRLKQDVFGGQSWAIGMTMKQYEKMQMGDAGFSLRDIAFNDSIRMSYTQSIFHEWTAAGQDPAMMMNGGPWEDTEENNSKTIKSMAHFIGAGAVGICELNTQWIYTHYEYGNMMIDTRFREVNIKDVVSPEKTDTEYIIPSSINRAVVMIIPQDGVTGQFAPSAFGDAPMSHAYSQMSEISGKIALAIRTMGYNAIALSNDIAMSIPMAIEAGLGELGRNNLLISPEYGASCRICKVITDMPLAIDKPITFGAAKFCITCKKCAEMCPTKSLSMDDLPSYDVYSEANNAGMKKWYSNGDSCIEGWVTDLGQTCTVCQRVCTYSKPQTWVHDVVKVISSKTTAFNSIFATMDDAFGYGRTIDDFTVDDINAWYTDDTTRNFNWNDM